MAPRSFSWDRKHREWSREAENKPFLQYRNNRIHEKLGSILEVFLGYDKEEDPERLYQVEELHTIFDEDCVSSLEGDQIGAVPSDLVAWLDERDVQGNRRVSGGFMSIFDLHKALKQERFACREHGEQECIQPDADRRIIYIKQLEKWALAVLILTTPTSQTEDLRRFLVSHLTSLTSAGVTISPNRRTIALELHLHYFVRRQSTLEIHIDPRRKVGVKTPRRESKRLSLLTSLSSSENNYLYESQISVLVSAFDKETYHGYCFVDGYYDAELNRANFEESNIDGTHYDGSDKLGAFDPCTRLKYAADPPINDAREYFLLVVDIQVKHVSNEWENTVSYVRRQIEERMSENKSLMASSQTSSLGTIKKRAKGIEDMYGWNSQVTSLLTALRYGVEETVIALEKFLRQDAYHFRSPKKSKGKGSAMRRNDLLHEISNSLDEIRRLLRELERLESMYGKSQQEFALYLNVGSNQSIFHQQWQLLLLQFYSPLTVAASILQANIISIRKVPQFVVFLLLTTFFGSATLATRPALTWLSELEVRKPPKPSRVQHEQKQTSERKQRHQLFQVLQRAPLWTLGLKVVRVREEATIDDEAGVAV